jgi:hypothetical protein
MDYFNLRYECLDACDDFHSKMEKDSVVLPGWKEFASSNRLSDDMEGSDDSGLPTYEIDMEIDTIGRHETKCRLSPGLAAS